MVDYRYGSTRTLKENINKRAVKRNGQKIQMESRKRKVESERKEDGGSKM
jgi:hypothetical protein